MTTDTKSIRDVMTTDPVMCDVATTVAAAAKQMRDEDIGDVIVTNDDRFFGILTDRDIVVRSDAEGDDPTTKPIGEICTRDVRCVAPSDSVRDVIRLMRDLAVRRIPVCDGDKAVGIVSLGDLAVEKEPDSVLGDISSAPPSN
jgi:CBS domain-containing protein